MSSSDPSITVTTYKEEVARLVDEYVATYCKGMSSIQALAAARKFAQEAVRKAKGEESWTQKYIQSEVCRLRSIAKSRRTIAKTVDKKVRPVAVRDATKSVLVDKPTDRRNRELSEEEVETLCNTEFLRPKEKEYLRSLVRRFAMIFSFDKNDFGKLNPSLFPPARIYTVPHDAWRYPAPKYAPPDEKRVIELIKEKLQSGVLEHCQSSYATRWFVIPKDDGSLRFIQDLQDLNKVTVRNVEEPPRIQEFVGKAAGKLIYSTLDLRSGYDQMILDPRDRDLTAMNTPLGLVRLTTLPQGFTNSVALFQSAMRKVLLEFMPDLSDVFVDDMFVFGDETDDGTIDEEGRRTFVMNHFKVLERIFARLAEVGLTISGSKAWLAVPEVRVLGYTCNKEGKRLTDEMCERVGTFEVPKDKTGVRSFLGLGNTYHMFIPNYAMLSRPLSQVAKPSADFVWGREQQEAFDAIKKAVVSAPVLVPFPDTTDVPIIVTTDASETGYGAVLEVEQEDGTHPIAYFSKSFNETQTRYPAAKRELMAIKEALRKFRPYLLGRKVIVRTDSTNAAAWIRNASPADTTLLNWIEAIKSFDVEVRSIAGKKNLVADYLSRISEINVVWSGDPDEKYREIIRVLRTQGSPEGTPNAEEFGKVSKTYELKDDILYRRPKAAGQRPRIVLVNEALRNLILKELHAGVLGGHRGIEATFWKLQCYFYWEEMFDDVRKYVLSCESCQKYNPSRTKEPQMATESSGIWKKVHVDLVLMPKGVRGFRYIINARDDLSGYVYADALRNKNTASVTRFLKRLISLYGCPEIFVGDRGELNNAKIRQKMEKLGITVRLTSAYHPQANGIVERGHQELIGSLKKWLGDRRQGLWPDYLDLAVFADNLTVRRGRGHSPFELMFGRDPLVDLQLNLPSNHVSTELSREDLLRYRLAELVRRDECAANAYNRLRKAREQAALIANSSRYTRKSPFKPGDLVFKTTATGEHTPKMDPKWYGPFRVTSDSLNGAYKLAELDGTDLAVAVHGSRLKPCLLREEGDGDMRT